MTELDYEAREARFMDIDASPAELARRLNRMQGICNFTGTSKRRMAQAYASRDLMARPAGRGPVITDDMVNQLLSDYGRRSQRRSREKIERIKAANPGVGKLARFSHHAKVAEYPLDFQTLLFDLIDGLGDEVYVHVAPISDHFDEHDEGMIGWRARDREQVDEFEDAFVLGDKFPPLVADCPGGLLRDGYHRLAVYRRRGLEECEFIYISEQRE